MYQLCFNLKYFKNIICRIIFWLLLELAVNVTISIKEIYTTQHRTHLPFFVIIQSTAHLHIYKIHISKSYIHIHTFTHTFHLITIYFLTTKVYIITIHNGSTRTQLNFITTKK